MEFSASNNYQNQAELAPYKVLRTGHRCHARYGASKIKFRFVRLGILNKYISEREVVGRDEKKDTEVRYSC